jgi:ribulose bisphosphate carboxylase small subunit
MEKLQGLYEIGNNQNDDVFLTLMLCCKYVSNFYIRMVYYDSLSAFEAMKK